MTEEIIKVLLENGADLNMKDNRQKTPRDYALDIGHLNTAKIMRYYNLRGLDNAIGYDALPKLNEDATASASEIQEYVDFVSGLEPFSVLNPKSQEIREMLPANDPNLKWKEEFDDLDRHLETAKETAQYWNIDVYPSMYRLYTDLNLYR